MFISILLLLFSMLIFFLFFLLLSLIGIQTVSHLTPRYHFLQTCSRFGRIFLPKICRRQSSQSHANHPSCLFIVCNEICGSYQSFIADQHSHFIVGSANGLSCIVSVLRECGQNKDTEVNESASKARTQGFRLKIDLTPSARGGSSVTLCWQK